MTTEAKYVYVNGKQKEPSLEEATGPKAQTNGIPPADAHGHSDHMKNITVPLRNVHAFTPQKKLRVVTIGCGYAGMTMAQKLQHKYKDEMNTILEHIIYEGRSKAGGTWLANTYPGVCYNSDHTRNKG